jgi:hypothetical protein
MPTTRQSTTCTVSCVNPNDRVLKNAHARNVNVQAWLYATYQREYENFTHLPGESLDALFQRFMVVVNNMRVNLNILP